MRLVRVYAQRMVLVDGILAVVACAVLVAIALTATQGPTPSLSTDLRQLLDRQDVVTDAADNMTAMLSDVLAILRSVGDAVDAAGLMPAAHEHDAAMLDAMAEVARAASAGLRDTVADMVASVEEARTALLALPFKKA